MLEEYLKDWSYFAVFILSALPWIESATVVVLAIALGLHPIWSTILAFTGNWLTVMLIVFLFHRWQEWRNKKRNVDERQLQESKKSKRAHKLFVKYGLPGLSLLGPLLIGTEVAVVFAMLFKAPRKNVIAWMTTSLAFWTVLFAAAAYYGLEFI
ncbi:small multi-drug export protein [Paenibacillus glycanilyticus]|uniref:small multi-drug export protein n=1 Tax=Paenibacillus glycanilyticus TaxID=126569 RepID=UPI00203CE251|nr:small multi-drug export protein [Paenibacillus glycanilyticus]MCM3628214.1 small multi-drug export protein [Paenibacillus glycanilyticus]